MKFISLIFFGIILLVLFVRYLESKSIFHPTKEVGMTPADLGIAFEDVFFETSDHVRLNGWFIKKPSAQSTLLWFHGNAGNISHRLDKLSLFYTLNLNIFIFDYRGYGKSERTPTEKGIYRDARAAYDYLAGRPDVDKNKIIAYGDSLGGVAAIDLAAQRALSCVIADSAFSSAADIARAIFPFVPGSVLAAKMDSAHKVKKIVIPKLFIHSINDEIIPFRLGKKLFDSAAEPKEFLEIKGGHNTNHIDSRELWFNGIKKFLVHLGLI